MISFLLCLAILIAGYFFYGKVVENTFGPDDRETPAVRINDGVDYVVLPQWKLFMIQLLNIAGLGPIFGALSGALWGPIVFLWITFGTIFAGGVHDYFSGMLSERNDGVSISEISGIYLGKTMKNVMRVFSVVLLIMVGTVFAVGPAGLLQLLCSNAPGILSSKMFWLILILVYYFIATFLSIDKLIGKVYPVFGICLIVMAVGVGLGIFPLRVICCDKDKIHVGISFTKRGNLLFQSIYLFVCKKSRFIYNTGLCRSSRKNKKDYQKQGETITDQTFHNRYPPNPSRRKSPAATELNRTARRFQLTGSRPQTFPFCPFIT